jgi:hypothetical protein
MQFAATGNNDIGGKLWEQYQTADTLSCKYLLEFSKNSKRPLWFTQGLGVN